MTFFRGIVLCSCVVAAFGQAPTAEVTTKDTTVTFRSATNLVPVSVVVRDRGGHAVGNLSLEDFQLFDNGKPQLISKFSVENIAKETAAEAPKTSASSPAPSAAGALTEANPDGIPDRFTAYIFDDLHLNLGDLARTRAAAKSQIDASMRPLSRAAIYTTSGRTTQEFTADRDKLHAALDAITSNAALTEDAARNNACPPIEYYMADRIYNQHDTAVWATYATDALGCSNSGVPTDSTSKVQAGDVSNCEITGSTDGICKAVKLTKEEARFALANGDRYTEASLEMMRVVVSRMTAVAGQRNIVLISPGFLVLNDKTGEEMAVIDRAIKAKVIIGGLDARGLYTDIQGGDASSRTNPVTMVDKGPLQKLATVMATDVVANIADGTGGTFYQGTNDYDEGFARVASAPDYVYVLGFSPADLKTDGKFHTLKVTLKDSRGLELQVRKGYFAPTTAAAPADKAKQEIQEAVFSREEVHDLPAILQTQYFTAGDGSATLTAVAKIDVKKLSFHKEGDRNRNDLTVTTALFDGDGNFVNGAQKVVEMRLLDETLEKRVAGGIAVKNSFAVRSGRYIVRLVVRDSEGQTMSAQSSVVEIP